MQLQNYNLSQTAYTPKNLMEIGLFGSRTSLYRAVNEQKLRITKQGGRTIFLAHDVAAYIELLQDTSSFRQIGDVASGDA